MIVLALLLPTLFGFLIITLLLCKDPDIGLIERLCLSYPIGMGMLTIQMFILGLLRIPLTLLFVSLPIFVEIIVLSFWLARKNVVVFPKPSFGLFDELTSKHSGWLKKVLLVILTAWAGVKLGSIFVEAGLRPIFGWDAWTNWSVGAKLFYYTKSLMLDVSPQDFFTRGAVQRLTAYPLHNPLMQTWLGLWAGSFDEVLVKFWSPVYMLCLSVYLYHVICREFNRLTSMALLTIFLSSPLLSYHAVEAYSDLTLSTYLFLALTSFLYAMRGKRAFWSLMGVFSAEAMFTKDEALFFAAPLILSAVVYLHQNKDTSLKRAYPLGMLLTPLLCVAPWYVFKFSHGLRLGADSIPLELTFHPEIIAPAIQDIMSLDNFNVIIVFLLILMLFSGKPTREFMYLFFPIVCYASFFFMLYAFTTFYYHHFSEGTVFYRNILTYYPGLFWLLALLLNKISTPANAVLKKHLHNV